MEKFKENRENYCHTSSKVPPVNKHCKSSTYCHRPTVQNGLKSTDTSWYYESPHPGGRFAKPLDIVEPN